MRTRVIVSGSAAALIAIAACQARPSSLSLQLAAVPQRSSVRVEVRADTQPTTKVTVVARYGSTISRRIIVTNGKGIATTTYDVAASKGIRTFSVTASLSQRSSIGSENLSTVSTTISL